LYLNLIPLSRKYFKYTRKFNGKFEQTSKRDIQRNYSCILTLYFNFCTISETGREVQASTIAAAAIYEQRYPAEQLRHSLRRLPAAARHRYCRHTPDLAPAA
jgi:hypothetical protein